MAESDNAGSGPGGRPRGWSLQQKAWLVTGGGLLVLGGLLAVGVDGVFRRGSAELEAAWVQENVRRVQAAVAAEVDELARGARDYATWTDTYDFAADRTLPYVDNNLIPSMFANLRLDALLLFDREGRMFAGRAYGDGVVMVEGLDELRALLAGPAREAVMGEGQEVKGALKLSDGVALFAVLPILRDDGTGPARGALAQVRQLDAARVEMLRQGLNLDMVLHEPAGAAVDRSLPPMSPILPETTFVRTDVSERELVLHVPLRDVRGMPAALWHVVLRRDINLQGGQARLVFYLVLAAVIAAAALLIGWLLRWLVIARLEAAHAAVQRVGETTDLSMRLPVTGADELSGLSEGINRMLTALERGEAERVEAERERERLGAQLQQAQKMEAIGTLAGGLAHDFNNLLTSIQGSATLIRLEGRLPADGDQHVRRIEQAAVQAAGLVRQMMAFGRRQPTVFTPQRLGSIVRDALRLLRSSMPRGIEFEFIDDVPDDHVNADAAQLQQVLVNLGTNASHAMAEGKGRLTIALSRVRLPDPARPETANVAPDEYLRLTMTDTGCGISKENLGRIFEPFFTTKPMGSGTGLGMAVVHGIVAQHRGTVGLESEVGRGTTFYLHFPRAEATAEPVTAAAAAQGGGAGKAARVLLVDDDEMVRDTLVAGVRRLGYDVVPVGGGVEALDLVRTSATGFDLVITDQMMPGMTGTELGQKLIAEQPGLRMILMTGYASALNEPNVKAMGFAAMLMKPVTMEELQRAIRAARER